MRFTVVAERSRGVFNGRGEPIRNPFIINMWDPNLKTRIERRTWNGLEAKDEAAVRKFFAQAVKRNINDMRGFALIRIEEEP